MYKPTQTYINPGDILDEAAIRTGLNLPPGTTIYNPIMRTSIDVKKFNELEYLLNMSDSDKKEKERGIVEKAIDTAGDVFLGVVIGVYTSK